MKIRNYSIIFIVLICFTNFCDNFKNGKTTFGQTKNASPDFGVDI